MLRSSDFRDESDDSDEAETEGFAAPRSTGTSVKTEERPPERDEAGSFETIGLDELLSMN